MCEHEHKHIAHKYVIVLKRRRMHAKKRRNNVWVIKFSDRYKVNGAMCVCVCRYCSYRTFYVWATKTGWSHFGECHKENPITVPQKYVEIAVCVRVCKWRGKYELMLSGKKRSQSRLYTIKYMYLPTFVQHVICPTNISLTLTNHPTDHKKLDIHTCTVQHQPSTNGDPTKIINKRRAE